MPHHAALFVAHGGACLLWLAVSRQWRGMWPACPAAVFARPWRELGFALLAVLAIVGFGQLYQLGLRLPANGAWAVLAENLNQLFVFSPVWILLAWRRQPLSTVLVPTARPAARLLLGVGLAIVAVSALAIAQGGASPIAALGQVAAFSNLRHCVQVLMEDLAITMLLVRASAALGGTWRIAVLVGAAFAAAHVPAMLADGADTAALGALVFDALLAVMVLVCLMRGRDVLWFVPVHWALDMTQFGH